MPKPDRAQTGTCEIDAAESPNLADLAKEVRHIEDAYRMAVECEFADLAEEMRRHISTNILPVFETLLCIEDLGEPGRAELCVAYQRLWRLAGA